MPARARDVRSLVSALSLALLACGPGIVPISECPPGAQVVGEAPPSGDQQRCMKPGDVRHGLSRAWHGNGRVSVETEWKDGIKHGRFTLWYESGQMRARGQDHEGTPVGTWTYWAEDGSVLQSREFGPRAPSQR